MPIKFLQLNTELSKHTHRIYPFLEKNQFDVICLQECTEGMVEEIKNKFGFLNSVYFPMGFWERHNTVVGLAIFSKFPITKEKIEILATSDESYGKEFLPTFGLLEAQILIDKKLVTFINTHLPVYYPASIVSEFQRSTYELFKAKLKERKSFLLTGDFNAPRGYYIFDDLASQYKDNVPKEEITTIDPVLHRAGPMIWVVDGIFSTKDYVVSDVKLLEGLSDHKGIIGELTIN